MSEQPVRLDSVLDEIGAARDEAYYHWRKAKEEEESRRKTFEALEKSRNVIINLANQMKTEANDG